MGKLIDADVLKSHYSWWRDDDEYKHIFNAIVDTQQEAVVRCKDCRYFAGEGMYCENNIIPMFDHFYCYYGERREP